MVAGPELARITLIEHSFPSVTKEDRRHHDQVPSVQVLFKKDVASLVSAFEEVGNPFEEDSKDLIALDSKVIVSNAVTQTVKNAVAIGQEQYKAFVSERFEKRSKPITAVIRTSFHCLVVLWKRILENKMPRLLCLKTTVPYSLVFILLVKIVKKTCQNSLNMKTTHGPHLWLKQVE